MRRCWAVDFLSTRAGSGHAAEQPADMMFAAEQPADMMFGVEINRSLAGGVRPGCPQT
jgi:hypothetical protein